MKKILIITLALLMMMPVINVFAYEGGLLHGKALNLATNATTVASTVTTITDGNLGTSYLLQAANATTIDTAYYTFATPVSISAYQLKATNTNIGVKFLASDESTISFIDPAEITGIKQDITPVNDVKKVVLYSTSSTLQVTVNEFDVFLNDGSQTITHEPVTNLTETHNHNSVNLDWTNPTGTEFTGTIIRQNGVEVTQLANNTSGFTVNGLSPETTYNFEIIAKYSDATNSTAESISVTTLAEPVDNSPTGEITNLMVEKTFESVSFVYSLPIDTDFSHLDIYRNGTLIKTNHTGNTFDDIGLVANTSYVYKFVSVDEMGNQSTGYSQTVMTDIEIDGQAPPVPTDVNTTDGNGSGQVTWETSSATDIDGYNVFIDGVKHNTNLIKGTTYTIPNLENATTYNITVSAVDTSGNESAQSTIMTITPSLNAMPIFEMKYSLKDVADGTSNWFGSLWLILAFSVAIPLTFLIARRIKGLMVA